uniref:Uncharacterized protein n=1 Tax=Manihot esculenta TaxID=3983 RepID=A0A2C9WPG2_MANES
MTLNERPRSHNDFAPSPSLACFMIHALTNIFIVICIIFFLSFFLPFFFPLIVILAGFLSPTMTVGDLAIKGLQ